MDYFDYSEKTRKKMQSIESYLIGKHGKLQDEWESLLDMMAQNLDILDMAQANIKANGLTFTGMGGKMFKNPALGVQKEATTSILAIIKELGISPYTNVKLTKTKASINDESKKDEDAAFLKSLVL